jgi:hypothetical protein
VVEPYARETIQNWVGDFCGGDELRAYDATLRDAAPELLERFLAAACAERDVAPGDVEEPDLRRALLGEVASLAIDERVRAEVPALCGELLADLERRRPARRRSRARRVRARAQARMARRHRKGHALRATWHAGRTQRSVSVRSGQKYKKCCMNRLG